MLRRDKKAQFTSNADINQTLPDEMLLHIFSFLETETRRLKAGLVCHKWQELATDAVFFQPQDSKEKDHLSSLTLLEKKKERCRKYLSKNEPARQFVLTGDTTLIKKLMALPDGETPSTTHNMSKRVKIKGKALMFVDNTHKIASNPDGSFYLTNPHIIILCPNASEPLIEQVRQLNARLTQLGDKKDALIYIVNGDIEGANYLSIALKEDDTIETFYDRMMELIGARQEAKSRCVIS
jgi:hypothetical protein